MPSVSVLMPVYNARRYLPFAIESILRQSMDDFEFLICDDASQDGSWELLQEYACQDRRIKLFRNETNMNVAHSLNVMLRHAQAPVIARMDADDMCHPHRLRIQLEELEKRDCDLLFTDFYTIDAVGRIVALYKHLDLPRALAVVRKSSRTSALYHATVMARRDCFLRAGGYPTQFGNREDLYLFKKLLDMRYRFAILRKPLYMVRVHFSNVTAVGTAGKRITRSNYNYELAKACIRGGDVRYWKPYFNGATLLQKLLLLVLRFSPYYRVKYWLLTGVWR